MRIGVTLPTFTDTIEPALRVAAEAEAAGLDGVFAFDHLWPMGRPGQPALWSFGALGAVAATTRRVAIGTLVARVGLLADDDLAGAFGALAAIAGRERVIAGLGTGDRLSAAENLAYGVAYPPAAERLAALGAMVDRMQGLGFETWVGGNSDAAAAVARDHGAARNVWQLPPEAIGSGPAGGGQVPRLTWGGVARGTREELVARLDVLGARGVEWCVLVPVGSLETICEVAETVR